MSARPGSLDRLRSYLDRLSSYRRLDLLKQVAMAGGRGGSSAELAMILEALRPGLEQDLRAESGLQFARLVFFRPCEPFVIDERGTTKHRGFIHRPSLDGLWKWLSFRTDNSNWTERTERAVEAILHGDLSEADSLVVGMRADAAAAIHEANDVANRSDLYRQKLTLRVGGAQAFADLADIAEVFEREVDLDRLGRHVAGYLGPESGSLDRNAISELVGVLAAQDDPLALSLVRVFRELPDPTDLIRLLTATEGTDDGAKLANSRLAGCVDVLLADLDFTAARIDRVIGQPEHFDRLHAELVRFHRIARALGVAIDLDKAPSWRTTLGERRRWIAASLSGEIGEAADSIVRALRAPRNAGEEAQQGERETRAIYLARLLAALRPLRSELAVNRSVMEALRKIEAHLETLYSATRLDTRPRAAMTPAERSRRETFEAVVSILAGPVAEEMEDEAEAAAAAEHATAEAV